MFFSGEKMNQLLILYANQKPFLIPTSVQSDLDKKIKTSDFLVSDDKGTHRLVGLKYVPGKMCAPVITFVCMRHEMALAKQLAFNTGKKIFYNSEVSAMLFKYQKGEVLHENDFLPVVMMYAQIIKSRRKVYHL